MPADGLKTGGAPTRPIDLPGVLIAATATLGFGLVLGPEGPLIALGMGLGVLAMQRVRKDAPGQALTLMAAAGSFAAVATIFGSPVIGAVLIIEAAGLGGAMLPLVLLPGLLSAGIGSLVFIGLGSFTGLSTAAWQLSPFPLPDYGGPRLGEFIWTLVLSIAIAVIVFGIMEIGRNTAQVVARRRIALTVTAGVGVGLLSIAYELTTDGPENAVLFSGQEAFGQLFAEAPTLATSTLVGLFVFKALAWGLSLGAFRGGPTFPAIFLGVVAGLVLGDLPGYAETPAVATLVGAACVSVLRLPLSSTMIALLLCVGTGLEVAPLVIVGVVAAYITSLSLSAFVDRRIGAGPPPVGGEAAAAAPRSGG